jgi:hypothetical protein
LSWKKSETLSPKKAEKKRARDMDQVVECLPRKSKALSSNSILPTKIKDYF